MRIVIIYVYVMNQLISPAPKLLSDLPRSHLLLLLCIRLAKELSIEDRDFQGFLYLICGISRVEQAFSGLKLILGALNANPGLAIVGPERGGTHYPR